MADFAEVDAQAFDTLGLRAAERPRHRCAGRRCRTLGGGDQQDVRGSPFRREEPAGPADPRLDRLGWPARHHRGAAAAADRRRRRRRRLPGLLHPDARRSSTCRSGSTSREYGSEDQWLHTRKVLLVRSAGDPHLLIRPVSAAVSRMSTRTRPRTTSRTMADQIAGWPSVTTARFLTSLFAVFGTLAVLLAMVGVYGVMSWVVGQRATEVGIRMALGAEPGQVVRMLLTQSLRPVVLGVVLGVGGGIGLGKVPEQPVLGDDDPRACRARRHRGPHAGGGDVGGVGADAPRADARPEPGPARRVTRFRWSTPLSVRIPMNRGPLRSVAVYLPALTASIILAIGATRSGLDAAQAHPRRPRRPPRPDSTSSSCTIPAPPRTPRSPTRACTNGWSRSGSRSAGSPAWSTTSGSGSRACSNRRPSRAANRRTRIIRISRWGARSRPANGPPGTSRCPSPRQTYWLNHYPKVSHTDLRRGLRGDDSGRRRQRSRRPRRRRQRSSDRQWRGRTARSPPDHHRRGRFARSTGRCYVSTSSASPRTPRCSAFGATAGSTCRRRRRARCALHAGRHGADARRRRVAGAGRGAARLHGEGARVRRRTARLSATSRRGRARRPAARTPSTLVPVTQNRDWRVYDWTDAPRRRESR